MRKKTIFPEIKIQNDIVGNDLHTILFTTLRQKNPVDGKYYLTEVLHRHIEKTTLHECVLNSVFATYYNSFLNEILNLQASGVNTNLKYIDFGLPVFKLDINQFDEYERLKN